MCIYDVNNEYVASLVMLPNLHNYEWPPPFYPWRCEESLCAVLLEVGSTFMAKLGE